MTGSSGQRVGHYMEDYCALTWPLVMTGLILPALFLILAIAGFISVAASGEDNSVFGVISSLSLGACMISLLLGRGVLLPRNLPTGIRIEAEGVRIGAVRSKQAIYRTPKAAYQNWAVFACPWDGVKRMEVITDPGRLRDLRRSPHFYTLSVRWAKPKYLSAVPVRCMLGILIPPFASAVLLIEVDSDWAVFPKVRSATFVKHGALVSGITKTSPENSLTWIVPTRHPERLRQALADTGR